MTDVLKVESGHGSEFELQIAGLGARSYAYLVDWHVRICVVLVWTLGAVLFLQYFPSDDSRVTMALYLPPTAFYFLYHPVVELFMEGNTPGKRYAKVRVMTLEGTVPGTGAILVRNVLRILDSLPMIYLIGMCCCLVTTQQRRIGDIAAGTLLVYESSDEGLVDDMEAFLVNSDLSLPQITAVKSLLSRWEDLETHNRLYLGQQLLEKLGRSNQTNDVKKIHADLLALIPGK